MASSTEDCYASTRQIAMQVFDKILQDESDDDDEIMLSDVSEEEDAADEDVEREFKIEVDDDDSESDDSSGGNADASSDDNESAYGYNLPRKRTWTSRNRIVLAAHHQYLPGPAPGHGGSPSQQTAMDTSFTPNVYRAKSGQTWVSTLPLQIKVEASDILAEAPGPRNMGAATTILDIWKLFMPHDMLDNIVRHTNEEGTRKRGDSWRAVVLTELMTVFGLLYFLGLCKASHENVKDFWKHGFFARPACQAAMSGTRFRDILTMLRFDDKTTRDVRKQNDKFAAVRDVFNIFAEKCRNHFNPGENVTVDEQLVPFRGRCPFRQYMPSKPARYGIKFWASVDSKYGYITNIQPYLGKVDGVRETMEEKTNIRSRVVKDLVKPIYKSGRNVTTSNYFTSVELAKDLLAEKLTIVGIIKGNRLEVPKELKPANVKRRAEKSSEFVFDGPMTLVSFIPKKRQSVLLLSTMHHDDTIHARSQNPDIIHHYNATKAGVDIDQMCSLYTVARITKRWPLVAFFNVMNLAAINACVLWCWNHPDWNATSSNRRGKFLQELAQEMMDPQLRMRAANPHGLHKTTRMALTNLGYDVTHHEHALPGEQQQQRLQQGRCHLCPPPSKRTTKVCVACRRFACKAHSTTDPAPIHCHYCFSGELEHDIPPTPKPIKVEHA